MELSLIANPLSAKSLGREDELYAWQNASKLVRSSKVRYRYPRLLSSARLVHAQNPNSIQPEAALSLDSALGLGFL